MVRWPCTDENPFQSYKNGAIPERVKSGDCQAVREELAGARGGLGYDCESEDSPLQNLSHLSRRLRKKEQKQFLRR